MHRSSRLALTILVAITVAKLGVAWPLVSDFNSAPGSLLIDVSIWKLPFQFGRNVFISFDSYEDLLWEMTATIFIVFGFIIISSTNYGRSSSSVSASWKRSGALEKPDPALSSSSNLVGWFPELSCNSCRRLQLNSPSTSRFMHAKTYTELQLTDFYELIYLHNCDRSKRRVSVNCDI